MHEHLPFGQEYVCYSSSSGLCFDCEILASNYSDSSCSSCCATTAWHCGGRQGGGGGASSNIGTCVTLSAVCSRNFSHVTTVHVRSGGNFGVRWQIITVREVGVVGARSLWLTSSWSGRGVAAVLTLMMVFVGFCFCVAGVTFAEARRMHRGQNFREAYFPRAMASYPKPEDLDYNLGSVVAIPASRYGSISGANPDAEETDSLLRSL